MQCNAVISLVDDHYYSRAWCSVEVMMVQTLKKAYNMQMWYEHVSSQTNATSGSMEDSDNHLEDGPMDLKIVMADKKLSHEEDRSKLQFLERQTQLLA